MEEYMKAFKEGFEKSKQKHSKEVGTEEYPKKEIRKNLIGLLFVFLFIIGLTIYLWPYIKPDPKPITNEVVTLNLASEAYVMMQAFVEDRLKTPSTAKFPFGQYATKISGQKYKVRSYVDSQNSFGAMIRTEFEGIIEKTGKDNWTLIELNFLD